MSDRKVRDLLAELDRLAVISNAPGIMSLPVRDMAENLRRAVNAPDDPQIIRSVEELEALDPATVVWPARHYGPYAVGTIAPDPFNPDWEPPLPAVVVATAEQVRAARKALEES
jgi:hypothetical protein